MTSFLDTLLPVRRSESWPWRWRPGRGRWRRQRWCWLRPQPSDWPTWSWSSRRQTNKQSCRQRAWRVKDSGQKQRWIYRLWFKISVTNNNYKITIALRICCHFYWLAHLWYKRVGNFIFANNLNICDEKKSNKPSRLRYSLAFWPFVFFRQSESDSSNLNLFSLRNVSRFQEIYFQNFNLLECNYFNLS